MTKILITGAAGFIGFHLSARMAGEGCDVLGIDNLNDYYDPRLKLARLADLGVRTDLLTEGTTIRSDTAGNFHFIKLDLADQSKTRELFHSGNFDYVVHLAAQPGARASLTHPYRYIDNNIIAFVNVLEGCRNTGIKHLVYASSSSVYGKNLKQPYSESDRVDEPVSLYAATKRSNELMAYSYSHLFKIPATGLRFFTVYGPWGRPDMAYFKFVKAILEGTPVEIFNFGQLERDFTYIDDIIEGVVKVITAPPDGDSPHHLFNIGHSEPVNLLYFIEVIEKTLGRQAIKSLLPMQAGDVLSTYADTTLLEEFAGFKPSTPIETGIRKFADWYLSYCAQPS
jgi:UDP-glucuronate 4-epimerase